MFFLFILSGSDYEGQEVDEEEEYDELDHREDGQFWITQDDGVGFPEESVYKEDHEEEISPKLEPVVSLFALGTLCRYPLSLSIYL